MARKHFGALALLAFLLIGLACVWMIGIGPVIVQAQDTDRTPIICLYDDGTWDDCPTAAPPAATSTPTPTVTSTPSPTVTPISSVEPSPTPESGTPPPTEPGPTPEPLKACKMRSTTVVNVRSGPGTQYGIRDKWRQGDEREFIRFNNSDRDYLWGYSEDGAGGWTAIYDKAAQFWFVAGTQGAALCVDLPGWPDNLTPPEPFAQQILDGPHIVMGEGGGAPVQFAEQFTAAKCVEPAFDMCRYIKAANPDAWIVARLYTDSIALDNDYDVDAVWNAVQAAIPADFDAFELENEVVPRTAAQWAKWSQFSIDFAQRLADEKGMQYLAFSFGPGWPDYDQYTYLVPYLRWVADNPLPDGRYHGIASHAAPYAPWSRGDMPWVNDWHIAGRVYAARDIMWVFDSFDLETWPGVWAITELGLSDGYSGSWDALYTCTEAASAYRETLRIYNERGYPHVLLWWNFGDIGGGWTSDHACMSELWG